MANTTDPSIMASDTELSSTVETKTLPLTANVARILLLLRSLQRGRHNLDDPWIVLPLQLHEYDDLLVRIDKNETLWGWMEWSATIPGQAPSSYEGPRLCMTDSDAQSRLLVKGIFSAGSATLLIKPPGKERVIIRHDPDSQFKYTRKYWPPVVFELANSPGPKSLSCLASDYILESRGNIRAFVWILRDEQGTPNPAKGSGLRLMLRDFAPRGLLESVDPDASLLINSAKLCKFLGEVEDSERIRAQGPMFTPREMNLIMEERCERTPEPVYEEDGFVFGEEELSVHARFLDTPVDTGKVVEGCMQGDGGEAE
ncbi:hypothetical protein V499_08690 [Pseudogymnoascus sp. VKM F-103]|nr:hypothetical protein V499_08690 [Pseudogymnoascus sp. VKM F-103]